jgi:hypothetical protein
MSPQEPAEMPRPVFIICAQSGSEDKDTHLLSMFNIMERIIIAPLPEGSDPLTTQPTNTLRVAAAWMRTEGDVPQKEFEHQMVFRPPSGQPPVTTEIVRFRFDKPYYRATAITSGFLFFAGMGILLVESRIRPVGTEEWLSQDYPILVSQPDGPTEEFNIERFDPGIPPFLS